MLGSWVGRDGGGLIGEGREPACWNWVFPFPLAWGMDGWLGPSQSLLSDQVQTGFFRGVEW